jgi:SpoVK/Ycf46/Vps4 family AAA+-type ATPase
MLFFFEGMNFLAVKGPELFNKYVGESEKAVSDLFRKARAASPSIIFFDEIDALASQRANSSNESGGGVADRVLSQLLTELDGIKPLKQVVVLAATNRPDLVDSALTRPGRIDRMLYVAPPDENARVDIYNIHTKNIPLHKDVNLIHLAKISSQYSGAEIASICREAALNSIEESEGDDDNIYVKQKHFLKALKNIQPKTTKDMLAFYENFLK